MAAISRDNEKFPYSGFLSFFLGRVHDCFSSTSSSACSHNGRRGRGGGGSREEGSGRVEGGPRVSPVAHRGRPFLRPCQTNNRARETLAPHSHTIYAQMHIGLNLGLDPFVALRPPHLHIRPAFQPLAYCNRLIIDLRLCNQVNIYIHIYI